MKVRGTRRVPGIAVLEMVQDLADDAGLVMKNDAHFAAAVLQINGSVLNTQRIKLPIVGESRA